MREIDKIRREIKADFALTHGLQADMTRRLEKTEQELAVVQAAVAQLQKGALETKEISRQIEGQLRLSGERFDKVLRVVTEEFAPMTELVGLEARLEQRLAEIERRFPPLGGGGGD